MTHNWGVFSLAHLYYNEYYRDDANVNQKLYGTIHQYPHIPWLPLAERKKQFIDHKEQ